MNIDLICQFGVTIFGITAIILVARKNKWGFVSGLISQPFWLVTFYINKQWGAFFVGVIYTFTWAYGIYEWFYKDKKNENK